MTDVACEWTLVTAPVLSALSVAQAKAQAHITHTTEDALVDSYIQAATGDAEAFMARGLLTQTWKLSLEAFADVLWLPMAAPLQNDAAANPSTAPIVKYYDVNGTLQTLATTVYTVDTTSRPGRIVRAPSQTWPALQGDRRSGKVEITYVVGWTAPELIPARIQQGLRLAVSACHCDRDGLEENSARARQAAEACWTDRVFWKPPQACA